MIVGFSNGVFYKLFSSEKDRYEEKMFNHLQFGSVDAIELHCRDAVELDQLLSLDQGILKRFNYISLHAPGFAYDNDLATINVFNKLKAVTDKIGLKNIVFHPDQVIQWNVLEKFSSLLPISIENMDDRKKSFRTFEEVKALLDKYDFGLTLDLQHCFVNDPTMQLATDFQEQLLDRMVQYHLSGYEVEMLHYPLYKTRQVQILKSLKYLNIPIIIESTFLKYEEAKEELEYISTYLRNSPKSL